MLAWIGYLLALSALLALAAWLAERPGRLRQQPTRWIWLIAIGASLCMPWIVPGLALVTSVLPKTGVPLPSITPNLTDPYSARPWIDLAAGPLSQAQNPLVDRWIQVLWVACFLLTIFWVVGTHLAVHARRGRWDARSYEGLDVLVSEDFGPAVIGVLRPCIVIPTWALSLPDATHKLILAHERSHLEAQDSRCLAVALAMISLAPWNPFLWWQLHRLRIAIEVDCDRRLLRAGVEPSEYASTLIDCSLRRSTASAAAAAMAEPASTLERRIALMDTPRKTGWSLTVAFGLLGAAGAAMAATQLEAPGSTSGSADTIEQYVGTYEFSSVTVLRIERVGAHLTATFSRRSSDLMNQGPDLFSFRNEQASISFIRDDAGRVTAATLHQNGVDTRAPRIGAERADTIERAVEAHIRSHQPAGDSEAALRHLIDGLSSGAPDYSAMSPQLAGGTRAMLASFKTSLARLGAVRSVRFQGVSQTGLDRYLVQQDHGASSWEIELDDHGTIVAAFWHEGAGSSGSTQRAM